MTTITEQMPKGSSLEAHVGVGNDIIETSTIFWFYECVPTQVPLHDADPNHGGPDYALESRDEYTLL